jgi:hypothetical protein
MPSVPSVMMKGVMRRPAMAAPLSRPISPPAATTASTTAGTGQPCWISNAPTTPQNAITNPTLRSMPPLTMISVIPSAPMATMHRLREDDLEVGVAQEIPADLVRDREEPDHEEEAEKGAGFREELFEGGHI